MIQTLKFLLAICFLLPGNLTFAQKEFNLEECIKIAIEQNIGIERQKLLVDLAQDNLQTAKANQLPIVEGFYAHNLSSGKTVNYENYTYINSKYQDGNIGITGSVPVFTGFANWYQRKSARHSVLSETEKKEELIKAVTIEVTAAYLQILFAGEALGVAEAKLESTQQQLKMNEGFFATGRISKVEVLTMKSQLAQDNLAKIQAENEVSTAYLALFQILNMDNADGLRISKPASLDGDFTPDIIDPEKINDYAQINHPGISSTEHLVKSRESLVSAMRAGLSPSISLNGIAYSRYSELGVDQMNPSSPYPYSRQLKDNMYSRASVNVTIPIFARLQNRSRINQTSIQARDARLTLDQKRLSIRHDIQMAYLAAINAKAKYEASDEAIESAWESLTMTQEKYKAGMSSSVDYKLAQNQLIQAQLTQIQSKYEFLIRSKILDLYLDKPITLE